jgi:hypothetical protein
VQQEPVLQTGEAPLQIGEAPVELNEEMVAPSTALMDRRAAGAAGGSYDAVRDAIDSGRLPAPAAVAPQQLVDTFDYGDRADAGQLLATLEAGAAPWAPAGGGTYLLRSAVAAGAAAPDGLLASELRVQLVLDARAVRASRRLGAAPAAGGVLAQGSLRQGEAVVAVHEVTLQPGLRADATVAVLRVLWRPAGGGAAREVERVVRAGDLAPSWQRASRSLRLAGVAARFGELLATPRGTAAPALAALAPEAAAVARDWPEQPRVAELATLVARAAELARRDR